MLLHSGWYILHYIWKSASYTTNTVLEDGLDSDFFYFFLASFGPVFVDLGELKCGATGGSVTVLLPSLLVLNRFSTLASAAR